MRTLMKQIILNATAFALLLIPTIILLSKEEKRRVVYFALQNDFKYISRSRTFSGMHSNCTAQMNVANIRDTIIDVRLMDQMYSIMLFSNDVTTTLPRSWVGTISLLNSLKSEEQSLVYNQSVLMNEFIIRKCDDDILIYYIPCNFNYTQGTKDVVRFVHEMRNAGVEDQVLIISNTHLANEVSALYGQHGHVIGVENFEKIVSLTVNFVQANRKSKTRLPSLRTSSQATSSKLPDDSTTASDHSSYTASSTQEATIELSTTLEPSLDSTTSELSSITYTQPTVSCSSSTGGTTQTTGTTKALTTSTYSSTTAATSHAVSTAMTRTSAKPEDDGIHCIFAADLLNFGRGADASQVVLKERDSVISVAELLINNVTTSSAGIFIYGYVKKNYQWKDVFSKMANSYADFWADANAKIQLGQRPFLDNNEMVIKSLNQAYDSRTKSKSNCMVYLTGMKNVTETKLRPRENFRRIVVISLQGANLTGIADERATVLNMSLPFSSKDADLVFHSIISGFDDFTM